MYLGSNNTSSKVSKYMCVCVLINAKNPARFLSKIGSIIFYIDLEVLIIEKYISHVILSTIMNSYLYRSFVLLMSYLNILNCAGFSGYNCLRYWQKF